MDSTIVGAMNDNINMDSTIMGAMNDNINMDSTIVGSLGGNESVQVFLIVCLYMYCRWRSSYQEGRIGILVTGLKPPHVSCAYTKPVP
jgi:hypothetical protein